LVDVAGFYTNLTGGPDSDTQISCQFDNPLIYKDFLESWLVAVLLRFTAYAHAVSEKMDEEYAAGKRGPVFTVNLAFT